MTGTMNFPSRNTVGAPSRTASGFGLQGPVDPDWPNRYASRLVDAAGVRWHVQMMGEGPALLLLHGTGSTVHSWRDVAPLLAHRFMVIAPDLPGHGFSHVRRSSSLSLPGMAQAVAELLDRLEVAPALAVGHSAGAAVAIRMAADGALRPSALVSINGALLPLGGLAGRVFGPAARTLALAPGLVASMVARRSASPGAVERMIRDTGSSLDPRGVELYRRVATWRPHVAGAIAMMARWDVRRLATSIPRLGLPLTLIVGSADRYVPPVQASRVRALVPAARMEILPGLGHLAHEQDPKRVCAIVERAAMDAGVSS